MQPREQRAVRGGVQQPWPLLPQPAASPRPPRVVDAENVRQACLFSVLNATGTTTGKSVLNATGTGTGEAAQGDTRRFWTYKKCLDLQAYLHVQWLRFQHVSAYSLRKTSGNTKD